MMRMAHVAHRQHRPRLERRDRRFHAGARRERPACVSGTIDRLRKDRVRAIVLRLDEHVEHFGRGDPQLIDGHRLDVLAIRGDDSQLQIRDAHVEGAHR
jgi:hypothetical protein